MVLGIAKEKMGSPDLLPCDDAAPPTECVTREGTTDNGDVVTYRRTRDDVDSGATVGTTTREALIVVPRVGTETWTRLEIASVSSGGAKIGYENWDNVSLQAWINGSCVGTLDVYLNPVWNIIGPCESQA